SRLEADYLALGLMNAVAVLSPQRIVVGGGVMKQPSLLPLVRRRVAELAAGYFDAPELGPAIDDYVVAPALGDRAGVLGALELPGRRRPGDAGELLDHTGRDGRREQRVAGGDGADRGDQLLRRVVLQHEPAGPGPEGLVDVLLEVEGGQDQDTRRLVGREDA